MRAPGSSTFDCDIPRNHHHAAHDGEDMAPTKRNDESENRINVQSAADDEGVPAQSRRWAGVLDELDPPERVDHAEPTGEERGEDAREESDYQCERQSGRDRARRQMKERQEPPGRIAAEGEELRQREP